MGNNDTTRLVRSPNGMLTYMTQEEWELYKRPKTPEEIEEMRQRKDDFIRYLQKVLEEQNKHNE